MKSTSVAYSHYALIAVLAFLMACNSSKVIAPEGQNNLNDSPGNSAFEKGYRPSKTKEIDILHTKLDLSIEWDSAYLHGLATLTIKPYFYSVQKIKLQARGFNILDVSELNGEDKTKLDYDYDKHDLVIDMGRALTSSDTIQIAIKYIAMPNKLEVGGSAAITEDKGLYFINEDESNPDKPRQLWTQGETEANSCWFPTVDSPNEKFTHEIYVTIEEDYTSISNGLKIFSVNNSDGTKTEYWKMDKPNTAYLVMLAVGPFSVYKDKWNEMEVNYYLDSTYLPFAHDIFGNTPEMLTFYSEYLGVPYPWQKYDQVVVHDYVSGAMENTTATIHGDFLQQTKRELNEYNNEDVIAHELFHHWFGDLVTCESWSNLTLNEGFATYGEYLWTEYKYGREEADFDFSNNMFAYMRESQERNVDMIRFYYDDKEDMFDSHSYAKGGLILHMLRDYVGNEAFKASLKHYLTKHAYQNVEIHDLRIAFEEVTGEDLNWFFNQWFLASGHPVLDVDYVYNKEDQTLTITADQKQDLQLYPEYRLPVNIEYMVGEKVEKIRFDIKKQHDTLILDCSDEVRYLNFDAGAYLLAEVELNQNNASWIDLYYNSELGIDKYKALDILSADSTFNNYNFYKEVLKHDHREIRGFALDYFIQIHDTEKSDSVRSILIDFAKNDENWGLKYSAIDYLKDQYEDKEMVELFKNGIKDSSIWVSSVSITALSNISEEEAKKIIPTIDDFQYGAIAGAVVGYYALYGNASDHEKLIEILDQIDGYNKYQAIKEYGKYLERLDLIDLYPSINYLEEASLNGDAWWVRMVAIKVVMDIHKRLKEDFSGSIEEIHLENKKFSEQEDDFAKIGVLLGLTDHILQEVKEKETRSNLVSMVDDYLSGKKTEKY